jgi:hypothetical protein
MTGEHIILKGSTLMAITNCPVEAVVLETVPAQPAYKEASELLVDIIGADGCGYIAAAGDSDNS